MGRQFGDPVRRAAEAFAPPRLITQLSRQDRTLGPIDPVQGQAMRFAIAPVEIVPVEMLGKSLHIVSQSDPLAMRKPVEPKQVIGKLSRNLV